MTIFRRLMASSARASSGRAKTGKRSSKWSKLSWYTGFTCSSFAVGYFTPIFSLSKIETPLTKDSLAGKKYLDDLQKKLDTLSIVTQLEKDPRYIESHAWDHLATESEPANSMAMTTGILSTIGGLSIAPRVFVNLEDKSLIAVVHYGYLLTGLLMFAHGGILGTLMDDILARAAGLSLLPDGANSLPERTQYGNTKSLSLSYKKPTTVNQFLVIRAATVNNSKSDVHVTGSIQTLHNSTVVLEASANVCIEKPSKHFYFF